MSAALIGVFVAVVVFLAVDLGTLPPWAQVAYLVISVLGPVAWTAAGLAIGTALSRAGAVRR